jgi:universal stress protein E
MDELNSILVVASRMPSDLPLLEKAVRFARSAGARIQLFYCDVHSGRPLGLESETGKAEQAWCDRVGDHVRYLEALTARVHARGVSVIPEADCDRSLSDAILRKVGQYHPDLVMKTPAGSHPLRLFTLDFNDWRLARNCPVTLMLVRGLMWAPAPRFGALVNVSEKAIRQLPGAILHACEYLSLGCEGEVEVTYCEDSGDPESAADRAAALERLTCEHHIPVARIHILHGDPDSLLPDFVAKQAYDVLVLGAPSHRRGLAAMAGGLNSKLVDAVDSDLLLVRQPVYESLAAGGLDQPAEQATCLS